MPKSVVKKHQPVKLYSKAIVLGYRRSGRHQQPQFSLLRIQGVKERKDTDFYLGKKVAFIYRGSKSSKEGNVRVIWGKVCTPHGNNGVVRARFRNNLPPKSFGATVRVMLYPSRV